MVEFTGDEEEFATAINQWFLIHVYILSLYNIHPTMCIHFCNNKAVGIYVINKNT